MDDLDAAQVAWAACDAAAHPAASERQHATAQSLALARTIAAGTAVDAPALWNWLVARWAAWRTADAALVGDSAARKAAAEGVRALLVIARNSAAQANHAITVLQHWDDVCGVLAHCLRFETMTEPALLPMVRVLAQLLANAATCDSALQRIVWKLHVLGEEASPSADAVQRLLSSPDPKTALAAAVLVLNCVDTAYEEELNGTMSTPPQKASFAHDVVHTSAGLRLIETLLSVYDAALLDEDTDTTDELIQVTAAIVQRLFKCGLFGVLFERLRPRTGDEPHISAHQVTLLQVLGACLDERLALRKGESKTNRMSTRMLSNVMQKSQRLAHSTAPLMPLFCELSAYAVRVMQQHVDGGGVDDFRGLIRAHMALLALLHALHLLGMCAQEDIVHRETSGETEFLAGMRNPASGVVDACLALLHEANRFFPAQSHFQPGREAQAAHIHARYPEAEGPDRPEGDDGRAKRLVSELATGRASGPDDRPTGGLEDGPAHGPAALRSSATHSPAAGAEGQEQASVDGGTRDGTPLSSDCAAPAPPEHHVPTATGRVHPVTDTRPALYRLKCSVLQLLGTLVYEPNGARHLPEVRALQDQVRERGGLLDTLNMTQLDKHNPYIREYAIFTLRYLLAGNAASQALIASLRAVPPEQASAKHTSDGSPPTPSGAASMP
ncbi:hypothetical protein MOBT1_002823 [Malassezia obtusa]|uniref:Ataxin-10 homolog n=1 Tax=Malassezia obtusa TaxID=76774 RepID=A0AAF0E317_9BASI|nr:hypothetical protein MOBT1_002823 [Malassezia obtusa]